MKSALEGFDGEIPLNPTSSLSIQPKLDSMLDAVGGLTKVEKIHALIREGESKKIEFKKTLSFESKTQTRAKYLEIEVLKTIVAFINSDGGVLLVGVSDDGVITGLNQEIEKFDSTLDDFRKRLKNLIKAHIGEPYYPFIDYQLIEIDEKKVLFVDVKPSQKLPCLLDEKDFYVRTNPATDKLEGSKQWDYIKIRFPEYF